MLRCMCIERMKATIKTEYGSTADRKNDGCVFDCMGQYNASVSLETQPFI